MTRLVSTCSGPWTHISSITHLGPDDILHVYDAFDEDSLKNLLEQKGYPQHIFQDSYTFYQGEMPCKFWCVDFWLGTEILQFQNLRPRPLTTNHVANFIINKKQINRFLTIKMVEFFKISCDYTWSGVDNNFDMSKILAEIDRLQDRNPWDDDTKSFFLRPIELQEKWIGHLSEKKNSSGISEYGGNRWTWDNGIGDIVSNSAISLITESVRFEKAIHFSEKTLYAMLGQTFPIWIGGYRQADEWEKLGFDVFKDILNHDYQYHDTLIERCWYAIYDNLDLLRDLVKVRQLREDLSRRLRNNFDMIKENTVQQQNQILASAWPTEIKQTISPIINLLFQNHTLK